MFGHKTIFISATLIAMAVLQIGSVARAEDDSVKSVELRLEGQCDANNSRLWLVNNHATKPIIAQLRWSLFNSKRVINDQFQVAPQAKIEVGCAARADIVGAQYAPQ